MTPAKRPGTIPSLDGIRAIAVSLVFFAHSGLEHLIPGGLGVTVFFVLSGFLITTLMRIEYDKLGRIDFRGFYLRRVLRLAPPLLVVVAAALVLSQLNIIEGDFSATGLLAVLFYFGNYFVIAKDFADLPAGIGIVWSLAVEEHYYLFYPPLALLLLRLGRVRLSATVLAGLCLAILAWRCWLSAQGAPEAYIEMASDTRIDAILVGCLLALGRSPWLDAVPTPNLRRDWAVILVCLSALLGSLAYRELWFRDTLRYTVQSLAIAPLLYLAVARADQRPFRWLSARPLVYIGSVSYTLYLTHHLILFGIKHHFPQAGWPATTLGAAMLTLAACELMRRWVDKPCADLRRRLHKTATSRPSPPRTTSAALESPLPGRVPELSVCIATYRRADRLDALLGDLCQQSLRPFEIIVVDNDRDASARATVERWKAQAPFPIIYDVQPVKNISITRNRSVEFARGEWIAFIDDDERAPTHWLTRLMHHALSSNYDGVLGPVEPVLPPEAPGWIRKGRFYDWARMQTGTPIPPNQLRFGNLVLRGSLLRTGAPPFDEAYGLTGGEDGDLLTRLQLDGARLSWCDEAVVLEPVESARLSARWLVRRSLRGGQDFARHTLAGRYGEVSTATRVSLFARALGQAAVAAALCLILWPLSRHRAVHWATKLSANLGKLTVFWGQHYREYA